MSRDQNTFSPYERTVKIESLLSLAAHNRQTLQYGTVAKLIGCGVIPRNLGPYLGSITDCCSTHNLPCLARLVVNKKSGEPGKKLPGTNEDVFAFDWIDYKKPTEKGRLKSTKCTVQVWSLLSLAAHNERELTYETVAKLTRRRSAEGVETHLQSITDYCAAYDLPCLARLVVSKKTGEPSEDLPGTNEDVFAFDWIEHETPTPKDFG